eukprot:COSAG05_NODE_1237_length_5434_cov_7.991565_3_plen_112_part_00
MERVAIEIVGDHHSGSSDITPGSTVYYMGNEFLVDKRAFEDAGEEVYRISSPAEPTPLFVSRKNLSTELPRRVSGNQPHTSTVAQQRSSTGTSSRRSSSMTSERPSTYLAQ